jgi:ketosteroid isomerase-like protein
MTTTATTISTQTFDTAALVAAIESRDAAAVTSLYADDATISIDDRDHPPATPQVLSGKTEIAAYYREICGRNIDHTVPRLVADAHGVAFEQHCRYPEGNRVVCLAVATLVNDRIARQTIAQAWD